MSELQQQQSPQLNKDILYIIAEKFISLKMNEFQQQKRPWYTEDILYIISEKLLARIPNYGRIIDFRERNCYTNFMGHNEMAFRTIISQFAKFKRIDFTNYDDYNEERIEFYKNKNDNFHHLMFQSEFGGPYIVPPGMLEYIIEKGKLRVDSIETHKFLSDDHATDIKELGEMNSLKAFCTLFLGKQIQIPDGLNNNILVKKFTVYESAMSIKNNLEAILAIDADELEITFRDYIITDCSKYKSTIIANNTKKITILCKFDFQSSKEEDIEKFAANFETCCYFLIRACPALNNLEFKIWPTFINSNSSTIFFENFHFTIKSMEARIKSINIGNEHLQISMKLNAQLIYVLQSHDFSKLGSPIIVDGEIVSRFLECVDACGRIHELLIKFRDVSDW